MSTGAVAVVAVLASLLSPVLVWWLFRMASSSASRRAMTKPPEHIADPGRVTGALFVAVILGSLLQFIAVVLVPANKDAGPKYALIACIGALGLVSAWLMHSLPGHRRNVKYILFMVSTSTASIGVSMLSARGGEGARFVAATIGGGLVFNLVVAAICVAVFRPDAPVVAGDASSLRALTWYRRLTWFQGSDFASGAVMGLTELVDSRVIERLRADPWGREYVYRSPGTDGRSFDLLSTGADGVEGTADDVRFERKGR